MGTQLQNPFTGGLAAYTQLARDNSAVNNLSSSIQGMGQSINRSKMQDLIKAGGENTPEMQSLALGLDKQGQDQFNRSNTQRVFDKRDSREGEAHVQKQAQGEIDLANSKLTQEVSLDTKALKTAYSEGNQSEIDRLTKKIPTIAAKQKEALYQIDQRAGQRSYMNALVSGDPTEIAKQKKLNPTIAYKADLAMKDAGRERAMKDMSFQDQSREFNKAGVIRGYNKVLSSGDPKAKAAYEAKYPEITRLANIERQRQQRQQVENSDEFITNEKYRAADAAITELAKFGDSGIEDETIPKVKKMLKALKEKGDIAGIQELISDVQSRVNRSRSGWLFRDDVDPSDIKYKDYGLKAN